MMREIAHLAAAAAVDHPDKVVAHLVDLVAHALAHLDERHHLQDPPARRDREAVVDRAERVEELLQGLALEVEVRGGRVPAVLGLRLADFVPVVERQHLRWHG
jgi:hypothetical protein